jgi:hypothetical protein
MSTPNAHGLDYIAQTNLHGHFIIQADSSLLLAITIQTSLPFHADGSFGVSRQWLVGRVAVARLAVCLADVGRACPSLSSLPDLPASNSNTRQKYREPHLSLPTYPKFISIEHSLTTSLVALALSTDFNEIHTAAW